jgi:hypothetical protein
MRRRDLASSPRKARRADSGITTVQHTWMHFSFAADVVRAEAAAAKK